MQGVLPSINMGFDYYAQAQHVWCEFNTSLRIFSGSQAGLEYDLKYHKDKIIFRPLLSTKRQDS